MLQRRGGRQSLLFSGRVMTLAQFLSMQERMAVILETFSPETPCAQRLQAASGSRGRWFCLRDPHICKGNHINYLCSPTQFFIHEDSTPTPQVLEKNKKFKRKKWANDPSDWRVIGREKKSALCVRQSLSRVRLFATP